MGKRFTYAWSGSVEDRTCSGVGVPLDPSRCRRRSDFRQRRAVSVAVKRERSTLRGGAAAARGTPQRPGRAASPNGRNRTGGCRECVLVRGGREKSRPGSPVTLASPEGGRPRRSSTGIVDRSATRRAGATRGIARHVAARRGAWLGAWLRFASPDSARLGLRSARLRAGRHGDIYVRVSQPRGRSGPRGER